MLLGKCFEKEWQVRANEALVALRATDGLLTAANTEIAELRTQLAAQIEANKVCICGGEAQRDWLPIETAPGTNESILICEGEAVAIGWWNADDELYYTGETRGVYDEPVTYHPTHWMPLPAARAKEKPCTTQP